MEEESDSESDELVPETDGDRRRHLTENTSAAELEGLKRFFPSIKEIPGKTLSIRGVCMI